MLLPVFRWLWKHLVLGDGVVAPLRPINEASTLLERIEALEEAVVDHEITLRTLRNKVLRKIQKGSDLAQDLNIPVHKGIISKAELALRKEHGFTQQSQGRIGTVEE